MKKKKLLSVITGVVIFTVSSLGMIQYPVSKSVNNSISLIKITLGGPARTISLFNSYIIKIAVVESVQNTGVPVSSKNTKQTNRLFKILFFTLNSILMTNEWLLMILAVIFTGILLNFIKLSGYRSESIMIFHKAKNYIRWSLKFTTPIQRCITALVDKYDINPINRSVCGRIKSPYFFRI